MDSSTSANAADTVKSAGKDALGALKILASNPVPGLPMAFESLGPTRALGAGVGFGVVTAICFLAWAYLFFGEFARPQGFGGFIKTLIWSLVPYASLVGGCLGARMVFRGKGGISHDCFIAGAVLLPISIFFLLAGLFGFANLDTALLILPFALCTAVLLLFSAFVRILAVSERAATIAVPLVIVVSGWISKIIFSALTDNSSPF